MMISPEPTTHDQPNAQTDTEIWKAVAGLEGYYEVSSHGRCRSLDRYDTYNRRQRGRILKQSLDKRGYPSIRFSRGDVKSGGTVHRLVAKAFHPNPTNLPQVNHKDGLKTNNHVSNLEWVTNLDNMRHAIANGLAIDHPFGRKAFRFKSAILVYDATGAHVDTFIGNADMKAKGYDWRNVNACLYGTRKTHRDMTFRRETP